MRIQAIETDTTAMSDSETAAVILRENDNPVLNVIYGRLVRHTDQMRADENGLGRKRLVREQTRTVAMLAEDSSILSSTAGKAAFFWRNAAKQTVGFMYVSGY